MLAFSLQGFLFSQFGLVQFGTCGFPPMVDIVLVGFKEYLCLTLLTLEGWDLGQVFKRVKDVNTAALEFDFSFYFLDFSCLLLPSYCVLGAALNVFSEK